MTQREKIAKYLDDFGSITPLQALNDLGVMRLAARINEMVRDGEQIVTEMVNSTNRYGQNIRYARYHKA